MLTCGFLSHLQPHEHMLFLSNVAEYEGARSVYVQYIHTLCVCKGRGGVDSVDNKETLGLANWKKKKPKHILAFRSLELIVVRPIQK